jgi:uncharacterized protein
MLPFMSTPCLGALTPHDGIIQEWWSQGEKRVDNKRSLAVIGSGIAGMAAAYLLRHDYHVTVYEGERRFGGHSHTVDVGDKAFDTGFMVFNNATYPYLNELFAHLNVEITPTEMSFSVQNLNTGLEWCGAGLSGLFAQRKNLLRLEHYKFILEINRFNNLAPKLIEQADAGELVECRLRDFQERWNFSQKFMTDYLIPMSGAVWSTPYEKMLDFPAITLLRFFKNHGLLGLNTHFQWYTVKGGSREYVKKITAPFATNSLLGDPVVSLERTSDSRVFVHTQSGNSRSFDRVVVATHGDQALKLLRSPTPFEQEVLSCFRYEKNRATVHSDTSVMPKITKNWSSWNFRYEKGDLNESSTIYYMNRLQHLDETVPYFVSINDRGKINPSLIHQIIDYTHPLFDLKAIEAQKKLPELNSIGPIYFVGSYHRYGFHEDALKSSVELAMFLTDKKNIKELLR